MIRVLQDHNFFVFSFFSFLYNFFLLTFLYINLPIFVMFPLFYVMHTVISALMLYVPLRYMYCKWNVLVKVCSSVFWNEFVSGFGIWKNPVSRKTKTNVSHNWSLCLQFQLHKTKFDWKSYKRIGHTKFIIYLSYQYIDK